MTFVKRRKECWPSWGSKSQVKVLSIHVNNMHKKDSSVDRMERVCQCEIPLELAFNLNKTILLKSFVERNYEKVGANFIITAICSVTNENVRLKDMCN